MRWRLLYFNSVIISKTLLKIITAFVNFCVKNPKSTKNFQSNYPDLMIRYPCL